MVHQIIFQGYWQHFFFLNKSFIHKAEILINHAKKLTKHEGGGPFGSRDDNVISCNKIKS